MFFGIIKHNLASVIYPTIKIVLLNVVLDMRIQTFN